MEISDSCTTISPVLALLSILRGVMSMAIYQREHVNRSNASASSHRGFTITIAPTTLGSPGSLGRYGAAERTKVTNVVICHRPIRHRYNCSLTFIPLRHARRNAFADWTHSGRGASNGTYPSRPQTPREVRVLTHQLACGHECEQVVQRTNHCHRSLGKESRVP
jgi:hypothetical protein